MADDRSVSIEVVYRGIFQKTLAQRICRSVVLAARKKGHTGTAFARYGDSPERNGGDNAFYIDKIFETFSANAGFMGFEIYYQKSGEACSLISTGNEHPNSAARYQELYRQP